MLRESVEEKEMKLGSDNGQARKKQSYKHTLLESVACVFMINATINLFVRVS
jgi:hypothetical protein